MRLPRPALFGFALWATACTRTPAAPAAAELLCPPGAHLVNRKLEHSCMLENGVREGPSTLLYSSGKVAQSGTYHDNHRHGRWTFWQEDGALWQEGEWRDGAVQELKPALLPCKPGTTRNGSPPPQGRAVWCQRAQADGTWINEGPFMSWHDDGQPQAQGANHDGDPDGEFTMWYPDGSLKARGAYARGKEQGLWLSWHDNGTMFIRASFENGKEQGPWVSWWEEGVKSAEGQFKNGLEQGAWTFWHPNGNKSEEGSYNEGKKMGWWRAWDAEGREQPMEEFRTGVRVSSGPSRDGGQSRPQ